jgi:glycosyltransferase involved in cell wall biosynthesis
MRIAMVHTPLWGRGGAERQILRLAIELQKRGNAVEIFTPVVNEKTCYPDLLKQVTVNVIPQSRFVPFNPGSEPSISSTSKVGEITDRKNRFQRIAVHQFYTSGLPSMLRLGKIIPKGFDIINNHNAPTEWAVFIAKRRLKVPVVWMCNEPPSWFYSGGKRGIGEKISWPLFEIWDKTSVKYIDEILVLSHAAQDLVRNVYNLPSRVVRTGLDVDKFVDVSGYELRKKLGLEKDFVLLQVANLAPVKRQFDSIMALHYLAKDHGNVKLVLDGAGPQEELRRFSEKLGVKDKVVFSHAKCDEELAEVYAVCDVFVFPPQITWGLAVVEAMASSKPVIVAKGCGVAEIIQDNVNGMQVEYAKPKAIAEKVESLINDPSLRRKMGRNAFEYVKDNLSWEKFAKNMESVFEQAISSFRKKS